MSSDTQPAMTYPTVEQYDRWKQQAEAFDMSVSEFMQAMVEAGLKKFDARVEPDETVDELREQRDDLKDELNHARSRIQRLEDRLHHGEQAAIKQYVRENPGATWDEVIQHVVDTVPERVTEHLDVMEGDTLQVEDGAYYPAEHTEDGA